MRKSKKQSETLFGPEPIAGEVQVGDKVTGDFGDGQEERVIVAKVRGGYQAEAGGEKPPTPKTGSGVAKHQPNAGISAAPDPFLSMIREVALNKDLDVKKLEALLEMQIRVQDRNAKIAFDAAMVKMAPKLPVITKDGKIVVDSKDGKKLEVPIIKGTYAKWETIQPIITPILHRHGFSLSHRSSSAPDGRLRVTAILKGHGHTDDTCYLDLSADTSGGKNNAQAWASVLSYGKRHTGCAVLNIVTRDEDDDATKGGGPPITIGEAMTEEEVDRIIELAGAAECPSPRLLQHMNSKKPKGHPEAKEIGHLPRARFQEAVDAIRLWEETKKSREAKNKPKEPQQ